MQFDSSMPYIVMENHVFNSATSTNGLNPLIMDGIASQASTSQFRHDAFDLNFQNGVMSGYPVISSLQEEPSNGFGLLSSEGLASRSFRSNRITEFQDHFTEGTPIPAAALASILASRTNFLQENVDISSPNVFPSQVLRSHISNECTNTSHLSYDTSLNDGYDNGVLGDMNNRWDFEKFLALPELSRISPPERSGFHSFRVMENMDHNPNAWISSNFNNELSLSLATTQPSIDRGPAFNDQCSDISSNETGLGSDQTSSNNSRDLSLSFGSYRPAQPHFSQVIPRSRYLNVVQDLLAEIARFSLENVDTEGVNPQHYSSCIADEDISMTASDFDTDPIWQRRDIGSKKAQLLSLLQIVDDRYNQCLDEIHTVISAFHAATELNPQMHARFALHTMSFLYKNIRDRISNQILAMGQNYKTGGQLKESEESTTFDTSFVQKQWALQQLKRKEHQLWRPQRGLPERSVSVLRAWMFQNFLHPYPKDAEKHLLAVKSGLTRGQVSNWFINARVRLWKPMIEEMYSEMNRRKARRGDDEGIESNGRSSHITMDNQRF